MRPAVSQDVTGLLLHRVSEPAGAVRDDLLFAAITVPLVVGAAFIERLVVSEHTLVCSTGGMLLIGLAAYTLLSGRLHL